VFAQPATGLDRSGVDRIVRVADGSKVTARTVILAPGIAWRRLGIPGLERLVGSGVFYGAAGTEAPAMEGRDVYVVGAGNSAGQTSLHLARYARRVTMLVRGDDLARSMSEYLITEIAATSNIEVRLGTEVTGGNGGEQLESLTIGEKASGRVEEVAAAALFVLIGGEPRTAWLPDDLRRDRGYLLTGLDLTREHPWPLGRPPLPLETSIPGVFAAGDARYRSIKRVASAVGDGATAVRLAHEYLEAQEIMPAGFEAVRSCSQDQSPRKSF
jgi:thioredoxin reductase (NADPH)